MLSDIATENYIPEVVDPETGEITQPDIAFWTKKFTKEFKQYSYLLRAKGWNKIAEGRHRAVFTRAVGSQKAVLKVSRVPKGVKANLFEYRAFLEHGGKIFKQTSELMGIGDIPIPEVRGHKIMGNLSVLCVEWVTRTDAAALLSDLGALQLDTPDWVGLVDYDKDGPQVGRTRDGRLVCFDWCTF